MAAIILEKVYSIEIILALIIAAVALINLVYGIYQQIKNIK